MFSHQSIQLCDHRNDEMIADQSLLDWRCLNSHDTWRKAWFWLAWESWRERVHADLYSQAYFWLYLWINWFSRW